jgi:hypothetical protein
MEHHKRFIKRIEGAKTLSIQKFNILPTTATIQKEHVKCGKDNCDISHGHTTMSTGRKKFLAATTILHLFGS